MLTEEERLALREGLKAAGLRGHLAEAIADYAVPSLEMSAAASTTVPVGATKIGGRPDLPEETAWPRRSDRIRERAMEPVLGTIPLAFLAQVELQEAARALPPDENPLPTSGVLSFFYDAYDQPWGYDPEDRHDFRVIHSGPKEDLAPAVPPEDLPEVCRFAQRAAWAAMCSSRSSLLARALLTRRSHPGCEWIAPTCSGRTPRRCAQPRAGSRASPSSSRKRLISSTATSRSKSTRQSRRCTRKSVPPLLEPRLPQPGSRGPCSHVPFYELLYELVERFAVAS